MTRHMRKCKNLIQSWVAARYAPAKPHVLVTYYKTNAAVLSNISAA